MSNKKDQHVMPNKSGWAVKGEGNSRNTKITKTKESAVSRAKRLQKEPGRCFLSGGFLFLWIKEWKYFKYI
ncbi:MAG: DUF2188 domain-containing protein [Ignavibacteria bacterium]|nr:DUF2188 domain-containing protein [Ignavibacteria bacterium]